MDDATIDRTFENARRQLARGHLHAAIASLRKVLSADPEHVDAHACLAIALHDNRRLHAASLEAERALAIDPESALAHLANAFVRFSARDWGKAREHAERAHALAPDDGAVVVATARIRHGMGDSEEARALARSALEIDPDEVDAHVLLGTIALERDRDRASARAHVDEALGIDPYDVSARVLHGYVALADGDVDTAREDALAALSESSNDRGALRLLVAVKSRSSVWLGLWWRFHAWLVGRDDGRIAAILLGLFAAKSVATQLAADLAHPSLALTMSLLWLAFCVYTWIAPSWFRRSLERELADVRLRDDF